MPGDAPSVFLLLLASVLAPTSVFGQSEPNLSPAIAEVRLDYDNNEVPYSSDALEYTIVLDSQGVPATYNNQTTNKVVDLRLELLGGDTPHEADSIQPKLKEMEELDWITDRFELTYKILQGGVDLASDLENFEYRARIFPVHKQLSQVRLQGDLRARLRWAVDLQDAQLDHHDFLKRIGNQKVLDATDWVIAANADLIGLFDPSEKSFAKRFWRHVALGKTSEKTATKLLSEALLEPVLVQNAGLLRNRLGGQGFGFLDDIVLKGSQEGFMAGKYAVGARASVLGSVVSIGYDASRGKSWDSPEMVGNYLDIALTGLWANIPVLQVAAPHVATIRQVGTELTKDFTIYWAEPLFMWDGPWGGGYRALRADKLWQIAGMTLRGTDPSLEFAQRAIDDLQVEPGVGDNKHFKELRRAFETGDKAAFADALGRLRSVLRKGGYDKAKIDDMQQALRATDQPNPIADFDLTEKQLGGVSLRALPDWEGSLGNVVGLVFDQSSGQVVLVGDGDEAVVDLSMEDLAAAFASVFGVVRGNTRFLGGPEFSLDPAGGDPDSVWQEAVYVPDFLYGTQMGHAMWAADWMLKQYSFGLEVEPLDWIYRETNEPLVGYGVEGWGNGLERTFCHRKRNFSPAGFQSIPEIRQSLQHRTDTVRNRLWIVVKEPVPILFDKGSFLFGPVTMGVEARRQVVVNGKLVDVLDESDQDPAAKDFARQMTARWNDIAATQPEFEALTTKVKAVAVAEWLKQSGAKLDDSWVLDFLNQRQHGVTGATRLTRSETTKTVRQEGRRIITTTESFTITGGADLKVKLKPRADKRGAKLEQAVRKNLEAFPDLPVFPVKLEDKALKAVVLPTSVDGIARWRNNQIHTAGGITYRVNKDNQVTSSLHASGTSRHYDWKDGKLAAIRAEFPDGTILKTERPGPSDKPRMSITTPKGVSYDLTWDRDLKKCTVQRDNKPYIKIFGEPAPEGDKLASYYSVETHVPSGAVRRTGFDKKQRIVSIEEMIPLEGKQQRREVMRIDRAANGAVKTVDLPDGRTVQFDYNQSTVDIAFSGRKLRLEADPRLGLPKRIIEGGVTIAELVYDAGGLLERFEGGGIVAQFDAGRLASWADKNDYEQKYAYHPNGTLKQISDNRGGTIDWNADGTWTGANLRDGLVLRAHYSDVPSVGGEALTSLTFHAP